MNKQPLLTLGFSATTTRLEPLLTMLARLEPDRHFEVLIVVQGEMVHGRNIPAHIRVIHDKRLGLSRSRNQVIDHSNGQYIWFLDDDVIIQQNSLQMLLGALTTNQRSQALRGRVGCIENPNRYYKSYGENERLNRWQLLQASSIELVIDRHFIRAHGIRFNESLGLGTAMPATEEVNFLLDIEQAGGTLTNLNQVLAYHTCNDQGRVLANEGIFRARGATASRFGLLGIALLLRWGIRYFLRYRRLSYVKSMIHGYYQGYGKLVQ
ncbi:glycosyltransferase [Thalassotalea mangrovi]|uniref:Glycosyltransferase family 2 protein n=1 Tax=Thalassotalea mangrovi TaxID=2572245 RepID=A0A4U1B589_9GAMM|nr:glycosyltransferase [Thalassotalea mangrovi]TKB45178.1 glycosyltransferase family 2 protein [Thalassotalea mangrovi]